MGKNQSRVYGPRKRRNGSEVINERIKIIAQAALPDLTEKELEFCRQRGKSSYCLRRCPANGGHLYFIDPRRKFRPKGFECTYCYRGVGGHSPERKVKPSFVSEVTIDPWHYYFLDPDGME